MAEPFPGEISDWSGAIAYLSQRHSEVRSLNAGLVHLRVNRPGGSVELRARRTELPNGRPWLMLVATLCEVTQLRARAALVANRTLPLGGIATLGNRVVLRQLVPLTGLLPAHLDTTLGALADLVLVLQHSLQAGGDEAPYAYLFR